MTRESEDPEESESTAQQPATQHTQAKNTDPHQHRNDHQSAANTRPEWTCKCSRILKHRKRRKPLSIKQWLTGERLRSNSDQTVTEADTDVDEGHLQAGPHVVIGADVIGLYPALDAEKSSEAVREETIKSGIEFEGVDWEEATTYLAINLDKFERKRMKVDSLVPTRRYVMGPKPTIHGKDSKSGKNMCSIKWVKKKAMFSKEEKAHIMGAVLKVGVRACFRNHVYKYCDELFKQTNGGPTGFQVTGRVAKLRMIKVLRKLKTILTKSGIKWEEMFIYVDDWRVVMKALKKGTVFCKECMQFNFSLEQFREDMKSGEPDDTRTARVVLEAMNTLGTDLQFTTKVASDFKDKTLPTLDFQLWTQEELNPTTNKMYTSIKYKFYEKGMGTKTTMLETSASSWQTKISVLTNEVTRRLITTREDLPEETKMEIMETYAEKLKKSGYSNNQVIDILTSGIVGYQRRKERLGKTHREAWETESEREMKKLTGKSTWYLNKERVKPKSKHNLSRSRSTRGGSTSHSSKRDERQPSAVLFVKRTPQGALTSELRRIEADLSKTLTRKVKVVERCGTQLQALLTRSDPWSDEDCTRESCVVCTMPQEKTPNCRQVNLTYRTTCRLCLAAGNSSSYIGETSRSLGERIGEHVQDSKTNQDKSHIAQHLMTHHMKDWEEHGSSMDAWKLFKVEILKTHTSAFKRQIHEAVSIMLEKGSLLNNRDEYNRCLIPTLEVQGHKGHNTEAKQAQKQADENLRKETDSNIELFRQTTNKRGNTTNTHIDTNTNHTQPNKKRKQTNVTHPTSTQKHNNIKGNMTHPNEMNKTQSVKKRKRDETQPQTGQSEANKVTQPDKEIQQDEQNPRPTKSKPKGNTKRNVTGRPKAVCDIRKFMTFSSRGNIKENQEGGSLGTKGDSNKINKSKSGASKNILRCKPRIRDQMTGEEDI